MKALYVFIFICILGSANAQVEETAIIINPTINKEYKARLQRPDTRNVNAIGLPFVDDFSIDHFLGNAAGNEVLWEDLSAYRNLSYGIEPPTIGVVTLDGLGANGYPHNGFSGSDFGPADTLTSMPIDLAGANNVFLSFFYQGGGLGNAPENVDSLVLEYYNMDTDHWDWQWSIPGLTTAPFEQIILPIDQGQYLHDNFQFRFRNYATIDGSFDHWNIDYVRLDENRTINDTLLIDVSFAEPIYTLLKNGITAMPWTHYQNDPSEKVVETKDLIIRNLRTQGAFINETGMEISYNGSTAITITDPQAPSIIPESNIAVTQEINTAPNNYFYDSGVNNISAIFDVRAHLVSSPNENLENDHLYFQQKFLNYYDYSDHTAESNFGIADFSGSGTIASKVTATMADSLEAIQIDFFPAGINSENGNIIITVWDDDGFQGSPGSILYQGTTIEHPIFSGEVDGYAIYELAEKVWVDEVYYIGFKQTTPERAVIGIDKNTIPTSERLYYNLSGTWTPAGVSGIAMMRPQYQSLIVPDGIEEWTADKSLTLWPNPAKTMVHITSNHSYQQAVLYNLYGQMLETKNINQNVIDLENLPSGMYLVQLITDDKTYNTIQKIVITR